LEPLHNRASTKQRKITARQYLVIVGETGSNLTAAGFFLGEALLWQGGQVSIAYMMHSNVGTYDFWAGLRGGMMKIDEQYDGKC
jgi:hypothetical protein